MAIILITGGSGLIGRALTQALRREGHAVRWLSRQADGPQRFAWDPAKGTIDVRALEGVEHIVHLAGAGIAYKRWTPTRVKELIDSRAASARLLLNAMREHVIVPKSFVSAAGIGYYGAVTNEHFFTENDAPGNDTIARISVEWERAADEWRALCRTVKLRTPVVLARDGGALPKLAAPARWGLAAPLGTGRQWMPWIHIDDLVRIYQQAIFSDAMAGAYNVNASEQPTNAAFMRAIAKALKRPFFLPSMPSFTLRIALGELSSVLLQGSRASNERSLSSGFRFQHNELDRTLNDLLQ